MKKIICIGALVVFSPVILPAMVVGVVIGLVAGGGYVGMRGALEATDAAVREVFK